MYKFISPNKDIYVYIIPAVSRDVANQLHSDFNTNDPSGSLSLRSTPIQSHTRFYNLFRRPNLHFSSDSDSDSDSDIPPKLEHAGKNLFSLYR